MSVGSVKTLQMMLLVRDVIRAGLCHCQVGISIDDGVGQEGTRGWM